MQIQPALIRKHFRIRKEKPQNKAKNQRSHHAVVKCAICVKFMNGKLVNYQKHYGSYASAEARVFELLTQFTFKVFFYYGLHLIFSEDLWGE